MALQPSTQFQVAQNSILDVNYRQAYLGTAYTIPMAAVALGGTSEVAILTIQNAATSAVSQFINLWDMSGSTASAQIIFRIYQTSTSISGGSAVTPVNCRSGSANTSVATVLKSPTVGGNGTLWSIFNVGATSPSVYNNLLIIDPGKVCCITAQAVTATASVVATIGYWEI